MFRNLTYGIAVLLLASSAVTAPNAWQKEIDQSASNLQAGHYAASSQIIDRTIAEMVEKLGGGQSENQLFATALVHKALASAGRGEVDDALWYWYVAQEISPSVAKTDLLPFGAAGDYLSRHPLAEAEAASGSSARAVKQVVPKFPAGASRFGIAGDLVVQIVIDKNGQPTRPRIVHPLPAPTLSYVALEALRRWRFEPATRNGERVPAVFNLTVHYKL
jgi:TonB family protein